LPESEKLDWKGKSFSPLIQFIHSVCGFSRAFSSFDSNDNLQDFFFYARQKKDLCRRLCILHNPHHRRQFASIDS